jgi:hypothetical protein
MFPKTLRLEVIGLIGLKILALTVIYFLLISPATIPEPSAAAMRAHFFSSQSP